MLIYIYIYKKYGIQERKEDLPWRLSNKIM